MLNDYNSQYPVISSHTGFQPLKEVWLCDIYPESFAQVVDLKYQDLFCTISEKTKKDLTQLNNKLQDLGVVVQRPTFDSIDNFLDEQENLIKPPICPRDWALTLGNTLYIIPQYQNSHSGFESTVELYKSNQQDVVILDRSGSDPMLNMVFPSVVRVGNDLLIDVPGDRTLALIQPVLDKLATQYRVHVSRTGDHSDGVFCPVTPGWIFSTHYRTQYKKTFPDWDVFFLTDTTKIRNNGHNGNWWLPDMPYPHYNQGVFEIAKNWIGDSRETVFEVNMLVVDEANVICITEDDQACKKLESLGITPHVVDISTRGFWDGGIHCLTLDINRQGSKIDYWHNRGNLGIYYQ